MVSVAIQARGRSGRKGCVNALVQLAGCPLFAHVLECANPLANEVPVITSSPHDHVRTTERIPAPTRVLAEDP